MIVLTLASSSHLYKAINTGFYQIFPFAIWNYGTPGRYMPG